MRPSRGSCVGPDIAEAGLRSVSQPLSSDSAAGSDVPAAAAGLSEPITPFDATVARERQTEATPAGVISTGSTPVHVDGKRAGAGGLNIPPYLKVLGVVFVAGLPALATLIGILFDLFPALRQDAPPPVLGATFHEVALEERGATLPGTTDAAFVVSYDLEFTGYKEDLGYVKWALFDPVSLEPLGPEAFGAPRPAGDYEVEPEAPNDRLNESIYVLKPLEAQCVFVRLYVYDAELGDDSRTRLDYADTPVFHTHNPMANCGGAAQAGRAS